MVTIPGMAASSIYSDLPPDFFTSQGATSAPPVASRERPLIDNLKYNLDKYATRVLCTYPFWYVWLGLSAVMFPMIENGNFIMKSIALLILGGFAFLGQWTKKAWQESDNTLVWVAIPIFCLFISCGFHNLTSGLKMLYVVIAIVSTFIALILNMNEMTSGYGNTFGGLLLFFCSPFVQYLSSQQFAFQGTVDLAWFILIGFIGTQIWIVFNFVMLIISLSRWIYHSWKALPVENRTVKIPPAVAAALIWIPLLNLFWVFLAFWQLARSYRNFRRDKFAEDPGGSASGLSLASCILFVVYHLLAAGLPILLLSTVDSYVYYDESSPIIIFAGLLSVLMIACWFVGIAFFGKAVAKIHEQGS